MKAYSVKGTYKGREIDQAYIDSDYPDRVKVDLWERKPNFNKIPQGEGHYFHHFVSFRDRKDCLSLLLEKRDGGTARKYLKMLGLRILKRVI